MPASQASFRTMIARVSPDDVVLYANGAMAAYLNISKRSLIGSPLEALAARATGEIAECFERPKTGKTANRLVTDDAGRVFELKTYSEGGVLDIVLDEVTTVESVNRDLQYASGTSVDLLNEEELRTARQPERRFMTIAHSQLNGIVHLAERLAPMETRLMVNSFIEEASDAILETGCTIDHASGEAVVGLFGAPRYFADHALRAIRAACNQLEKGAHLRAGFFRQGKEMPPMSCGIWSGETLIGTLGSSTRLHYSAIGEPVEMSATLSRIARPGEVLVSEMTLRSVIQNLPDGWQAVRAESEDEPDLSDFQWTGDQITALAPEFVRGVWLIGPGVEEDTSCVEFYLDYLWALTVPRHDAPVPILRVVRPSIVGDGLELSSDNVVAAQFSETLGKYKLLSVIGTGGMGKVWKGQDRYGNVVAIKVLHTSETASESQLKRFKREAEVMARLPHRNICRIFEMSEFESIQFLVMEFIDGLTLADLLYERTGGESSGVAGVLLDLKSLIQTLRSEKSIRTESGVEGADETASGRAKTTRVLPVEQTLNMFLKVCDAVQFAHEHGVLHRDLKPGNILLREDGEPLVADFGLAKLESDGTGHSLSVTGNVVGTLENMAPEQAESSKNVDERADVYSLGTILYQMLTGRRHFEATGNIVADAQALQNYEPPRPRTINPRLDSDLEIILLKSLRNSPAERYRTVAALAADLERYRHGEVITARPVSVIELVRKLILRNRAVSAVAIISLLILIAGSVVAFWKITDRAAEAELARATAVEALAQTENQRRLALQLQAEAQSQAKEAERQRLEAETALKKLTEAEAAEAHARTLAAGALQETKGEREARERAEQARAEAEHQLALLNEKRELEEARRREQMANRPRFANPAPQEESEAARQAYFSAMRSFNESLSTYELYRLANNPEEVLRRATSAMNDVSQALLADPSFPPAWILKGRLHLAMMEVGRAREAFETAVTTAARRREADRQDFLGDVAPSLLIAICDSLPGASSDRFAKSAEMIRASGQDDDKNVANILEFFGTKPALIKSSIGSDPLARSASPAEAALGLIIGNGGTGEVAVAGSEMTISGIAKLPDLSALKAFPTISRLKIEGASEIDWKGLAPLQLSALDLSGCTIAAVPLTALGLTRVRTLSVDGTGIADITFTRQLPLLEDLDIANTNVKNLALLASSRRLRSLDVGNLAIENLRSLLSLPLERVTLSPEMVLDKVGLSQLRGHGTIKILRSPSDPEDFAAADFWKKFDEGGYGTVD